MKSVVLALAIGLALSGAIACEAELDGAPCPCVEPDYTCIGNVCRRPGDSGPEFPDASQGDADGGPISDGGAGGSPDAAEFFPESSLL